MFVDAITFVAVAVVALLLRVRREPQPSDGEEERARDGIAYLFRDRTLSLVMIVAFSSLLFMSAVWVGELFFVKDVLDAERHRLRRLPLGLDRWDGDRGAVPLEARRRRRGGGVGLAAATIQGAALAVPTLWLALGFFLACSFVGGLGHGVKNVMFRSLIHVRVPDRLHGRAFAAYNGIRNGAELGAFAAGGVLVAAIGPTRDPRLRGRHLGPRRADRLARAAPDEPRLGREGARRGRPASGASTATDAERVA